MQKPSLKRSCGWKRVSPAASCLLVFGTPSLAGAVPVAARMLVLMPRPFCFETLRGLGSGTASGRGGFNHGILPARVETIPVRMCVAMLLNDLHAIVFM